VKTVELYRFVQDSSVTTLTSADTEQTHSAETYDPVAMGRSIISQNGELSKSNIEVTMTLNNVWARYWMSATSESPLSLTIYSKNALSTSIIWKGRLAGINPQTSDVKFVFESIFTSMRRPGLRARFQRNCRHPLYGPRCGVDKDDFAEVREVTAISGNVVTIPGAASDPAGDYFTGMLLAPDGTLRFITGHSGATITLTRPILTLTAAVLIAPTDVTLYPGCNRSRTRCNARFNNLVRNGGFPFMPLRNPFDGSSII
jgi:hypothetical protein